MTYKQQLHEFGEEVKAYEATGKVNKPLTGIVFYASAKAMRERYYREGEHVTVSAYRNYRHYSDNFIEVNLTSDPTSYIHLTLYKAK